MVRIKKSPLPEGVIIKSEKDYQSGVVFRLLLDDCYHKCYICEHNELIPPEVEHRVAHRGDDKLKYDWDNIFCSCVYCNRVKNQRKFYDGIIDPVKVDPEKYIELYMEYNEGLQKKIVIVKKLDDVEFVDVTIELLDLVYNNLSTDNKKEAAVHLRNALSREISDFISYINEYLENPEDTVVSDIIRDELSRESNFAGFKRQIIRSKVNEDNNLLQTFREDVVI
jgi:predicted metal-binding transcription factor (methanogenesis marker protein 9)